MELLQWISKYFRDEQLILKPYAFLELQLPIYLSKRVLGYSHIYFWSLRDAARILLFI